MKVRNYRCTIIYFLLFSIGVALAPAQELKKVSAAEAETRLVKGIKPQYPPMAKVAHIQGDVIMTATITETGSVRDLKVAMGHPILAQAAMEAVRHNEYQPFMENGQPVAVRTTIKVGFVMAESPLEGDFHQASNACQLAIERQQFAEGEAVCNHAAELAAQLPDGFDRYRFAAFGNAGRVATRLNKPADAAHDFEQQVNLAQSSRQFMFSTETSVLDARLNLARAYQASGDLQKAASAYGATERAIHSSLGNLNGGRMQARPADNNASLERSLQKGLKQTLEEHAALLRQMGKQSEADELEQRARSLPAD
jgi:TonB family protein